MPTMEKQRTEVGVKVWMQSMIFVSNQLMRILLDILDARRLDNKWLIDQRKVISDGLWTWLTARQLLALYLEIYQPGSNQAEERWDMNFKYEEPSSAALNDPDVKGVYESYWEQIKGLLGRLGKLPDGVQYRVVANLEDGAYTVPGWSPTTFKSVDHLKKQRLGDAVTSPAIKMMMEYYGRL